MLFLEMKTLENILKIKDIVSEGKRLIKYTENNNIITAKLYELEAHDIASLIVKVQAYPLDEEEVNRIVEVKTNLSEEFIISFPSATSGFIIFSVNQV